MRTHLLATTAVMALLSASTVSTRAQINWTGAIDSNWFNAGNWSAGVPAGTNATINVTPPAAVVEIPGATAGSLDVGTLVGVGNLIIRNGGTLTTFGGGNIGTGLARGDVTVTGPGSQLFVINSGIQVGGLAASGIGILRVENGGFVNGQVLGPPQIIAVGGGGFFGGALIGDGGVTSTQINA